MLIKQNDEVVDLEYPSFIAADPRGSAALARVD